MLTNISIKNYKAFENATIELKPITILLGANSVGKSSIIQLILMLQQTGRAGLKSYKSALKLYGGYVNMGNAENLFRMKDTKKLITFSFTIKNDLITQKLKDSYLNSFNEFFQFLPMFFKINEYNEILEKPITNKREFNKYLNSIIESIYNDDTSSEYKQTIINQIRSNTDLPLSPLNKTTKNEFKETFNYLNNFPKKIKSNKFEIIYKLKFNKENNNLEVIFFKVIQDNNIIIELDRQNNFYVNSDLLNVTDEVIREIESNFIIENTIFNSFLPIEYKNNPVSMKASIIILIINLVQSELKNEFSDENINYVSPLRAHPKRYYMLDKAKVNLTLDTLDGDAVAEVLKDNKHITRSVNEWLEKFGVEVDVKEFKEVLHHLIVKQNNVDLDITDVGFGISQILPVIIQGFLSPANSTTIIEQPEIHLHPKMQAELADLFIDIVNNSTGKKLIIETHSEYLLKRLRRRISEGKIQSEHVSICLFNPQNLDHSAYISNLKIANRGQFEWPIDFYGGEIFNDTIEFIKNQTN